MRRRGVPARSLVLMAVVACAALPGAASAATPTCTNPAVTCRTGTAPDGSTWKLEVPRHWNRTLLLYSHGYVPPTTPTGEPATNPPADDFQDRTAADELLSEGYALAGSSYANVGWAVQEAVPDQLFVLKQFQRDIGRPARTIAWGHSMGGMITADLVQRFPHLFDAALPMCGLLGGGVGLWNENLDLETAFKALMQADPNPAVSGPASTLVIANVTDPAANVGAAEAALAGAQQTPAGRARLALVAALFDLPGWFDPTKPEPAATDYAAQEANQFSALQVQLAFVFGFRAELEARAGGNPTWNTGVEYRDVLARSAFADEARALYGAAGLDLDADLARIDAAPRTQADPGAVRYMIRNVAFDGRIAIPVLTMHTTSDWLVPAPHEQSYASAVDTAGNGALLRQLFVHRAGHCTFDDGEMLAALHTLVHRIDTGRWQGLAPAQLNAAAAGYGPSFNAFAPAFTLFDPPPFLRPFVLPPGGSWGRS
jgi:pimeloyl-ACP methyl ester carboxylesterase